MTTDEQIHPGVGDNSRMGENRKHKNPKRVLMVGGTFDDAKGKKSSVAQTMFDYLSKNIGEAGGIDCTILNGGRFSELEAGLAGLIQNALETEERAYEGPADLIYWFPKIPNDKEKIVRRIKEIHPACVLITSKDNTSGSYSFADLTFHAISNHSNLFIEFTRQEGRFAGQVADPLGNVYLKQTTDVQEIARVAHTRALDIFRYSRVGSRCVSPPSYSPDIPIEEKFFSLVRQYADVFHSLIHGKNPTRFFGNASFRCESGFPSFRATGSSGDYGKGQTCVSRRNIDKRAIGPEGFVALAPYGGGFDPWNLLKEPPVLDPIGYFGEVKPSVDTPIIEALFSFFPQLRYSLHGHVYIQGVGFTRRVIPCGAVDEAREIIEMAGVGDIDEMLQDRAHPQDHLGGWRQNLTTLAINLRGHGSLIMVKDLKDLENIPYIPRPIPEFQPDYQFTKGAGSIGR